MKIKKIHWIGIGIGIFLIVLSLFFIGGNLFSLLMGIGIISIVFPFIFSVIQEVNEASKKEEMFLEFTRNLVESVNSGNPLNQSIVNMGKKQFGVLTPNIKKLSNQIVSGVPLTFALKVFARDVNNPVVSKALTLIGQAEKAGGNIGEILESVADAVSTSNRLKKERKAMISSLIVEAYIIFLVFIGIILIVQFKIIPMLSGVEVAQDVTTSLSTSQSGSDISSESLSSTFLALLLVQGFFSGLATGKLAERSLKAGLKHSFVLMVMAFLSFAVANFFFA
ncbi:MAG: type II secretion system F family protein [Nanoarchaeota archaeon]